MENDIYNYYFGDKMILDSFTLQQNSLVFSYNDLLLFHLFKHLAQNQK